MSNQQQKDGRMSAAIRLIRCLEFRRLSFYLHRAMYSRTNMPQNDWRSMAYIDIRQKGEVSTLKLNTDYFVKNIKAWFDSAKRYDPALYYYPEDLEWLIDKVQALGRPTELFSLLYTTSSCSWVVLTASQVAELTGESEEVWMHRAMNREVMATQDGQYRWIFSKAILQMEGYLPSSNTHEGDKTHD